MARSDGNRALEELYRTLMDQQFGFMPRGEHHLRHVYAAVNQRHPELCDDNYLCSASCKNGTNSPEWQHVVRAVLNGIRGGGLVAKGHSHGYWMFGESNGVILESNGVILNEMEIVEGRRLLKLHRVRERKRQLVSRKKKVVLEAIGRLSCEACEFDFAKSYGKLGAGFAECHHRLPLAEFVEESPTRLADLAIVCANCHRMLHRSQPMLSVEDLRSLVLHRSCE